ncbi:MAG: hypothetical protein JSS30_02905 [Verrucomicrobia bacterium]|nr:hypothetical protein [Verrucomicrobiota bacterium]
MKIAIIGGGPVGLWTASQIKIRRPEADVTVYEKHPLYQRVHPLVLSHSSLSGIPEDKRIQAVVQGFKALKPRGFFWKSSTISTKKIESDLEALATNVGVKILKSHPIDDCSSLDADVIIGADGSHSLVRKQIFDETKATRKQLHRIVEVKYLVSGHTDLIGKTIDPASSFIDERVAAQDDEGNTPVSLRFFVTKKEYEVMQNATFRNPYTLEQLPPSLQKKVFQRLDHRAKKFHETRVLGSEKVTAIPLETYSSNSFVKRIADKIYCLVGDAAFGVPFFRSLNNGLLCGTELASRISYGLESAEKLDASLYYYNLYTHARSKWEILAATIKGLFIQIAEWFVYLIKLPFELLSPQSIQRPVLAY